MSDELKLSGSLSATLIRAHRSLLKNAQEHIGAGRYQEAILIAQAGAEASSARAITALLAQHPKLLKDALIGAFGAYSRYNLSSKNAQQVWTFLTTNVITDEKFWSEYKVHLERRNEAAHNTALHLGQDDADSSLRAATAFIDHIEQVTDSILGPNTW